MNGVYYRLRDLSITGYTEKRKKSPSVGEAEEKMMASKKSGFSWTDVQVWLPEG